MEWLNLTGDMPAIVRCQRNCSVCRIEVLFWQARKEEGEMFMHQEDATRHLEIALEMQTQRTMWQWLPWLKMLLLVLTLLFFTFFSIIIELSSEMDMLKRRKARREMFRTLKQTQSISEPMSNNLEGVSNQAENATFLVCCSFFPDWCSISSPYWSQNLAFREFAVSVSMWPHSRTEELFSENSRQSQCCKPFL